MKASPHFVATLRTGIALLRDKYGADAVNNARPWALFFAVSDSVSPGQRHNARVDMPEDEQFHRERMELSDAHIETAIKAALK